MESDIYHVVRSFTSSNLLIVCVATIDFKRIEWEYHVYIAGIYCFVFCADLIL